MVTRFAQKITEAPYAFTFDDLILLPGFSKVEPSEVSLASRVTKNIHVNLPFVSSPMDTVTEEEMAIALSRAGGVGVVHRNCTSEEELSMVKKVKRSESFIIRDVVTIQPDITVGEAQNMMESNGINGLPVVEGGKLVGMITSRDVRFADPGLRVREAMTRDVVTGSEGITPEEATDLMQSHKIEKLPIVDTENRLVGLITYKDVRSREKHRGATRDSNGRLVVGAAVSPYDLERAKTLSKYADFLVLDVAHFHTLNVIEATKKLVREVEGVDIVVGNIGTKSSALDVCSSLERVDGVRVGMGSGSVCTTTQITKAGSPTPFSTAQVSDAIDELGMDIPVIADGGIRGAGDIAISLALGAAVAMMGYVFAGCKESPGETTVVDGKLYKLHRGMGSASARAKRFALDRYSQPSKGIPEGTEAWVPYKGEVQSVISELSSALRASLGYAGASNLRELQEVGTVAFSSGIKRPNDMVFRVY